MQVESIDHVVMTVEDIPRACDFYSKVLGMKVVTFGSGRTALAFGRQKINLHQSGHEIAPAARKPTPGALDLCLLTEVPLPRVQEHLAACGVEVELGPVERTGAQGAIRSVYFRDPDGNLIEVSNRLAGSPS